MPADHSGCRTTSRRRPLVVIAEKGQSHRRLAPGVRGCGARARGIGRAVARPDWHFVRYQPAGSSDLCGRAGIAVRGRGGRIITAGVDRRTRPISRGVERRMILSPVRVACTCFVPDTQVLSGFGGLRMSTFVVQTFTGWGRQIGRRTSRELQPAAILRTVRHCRQHIGDVGDVGDG